MGKRSRYSPEVRERAVRLVLEHGQEHKSQLGGDLLDRREAGMYGRDVAQVGPAG